MTPQQYEAQHVLCDTLERGHTCECGLFLEWAYAHRPGGISNQIFQTCPDCGRKYRKYMRPEEYRRFGPTPSKKGKRDRDKTENPITPYDSDGMSLGEALRRMREEDASR